MAKTKVEDWSTTDSLNTDVGGTDIAEGCAPGGINDALRKIMAQIATWAASLLGKTEAAATYLPLAGGTLTGGLTGTTAAFSGNVSGAEATFSSVTATNSSGSYVNLSGGSSPGTGQLQFVYAGTRVAFIYQPTTGTGAGTLVFGKDDSNGFTFTGGPLRIVDDQFYLSAFSANNFGINFKTGIAIQVDRSTNKFLFVQAGGVVASIDASGNLKVAGNITANTTP